LGLTLLEVEFRLLEGLLLVLDEKLTELQVVEFKKGFHFRVLHVMERERDAVT